jgi:cytochrome c oxidase subunit 4
MHSTNRASLEHIVPTRVYYTIFAILMLCTGLTVAIAYIDLESFAVGHTPGFVYRFADMTTVVAVAGALNVIVALTIATFKAALVILFFMHVKYGTRLTWAVVVGSVFWLGILLVLTFSDYLTRARLTFG